MEKKGLRFLYNTVLGRTVLKLLCAPQISNLCGRFLDCRLSVRLIPGFIKSNNIDMSDYEDREYESFNDFFTRKLVADRRPVCMDSNAFIAPSDGLLSVYRINDEAIFRIKKSSYSVRELLKNNELAKEYDGGLCFVFRLCVDNYHRYHYVDDGIKGDNVFIPGILHTVRPIAFSHYKVFLENAREYTMIDTDNFGKIVQMEVGAMLVGKIHNHHREAVVKRGDEKGYFLYGGSTVIVLVKKNTVVPDGRIVASIKEGKECPVKMGERIGSRSMYSRGQ